MYHTTESILTLLTKFIVYLAFLGSFLFLVVVVGLSQCSVSSTQNAVLIRVLLLWRDTLAKADFIKTFRGLAYSLRGSVHYHGLGQGELSWQAGMVLEEKLRVLDLDLKAAAGDCATLGIAWAYIRPQTHPYGNTFPPTRPSPPIVPLPMDQAFIHVSQWGLSLFKPLRIQFETYCVFLFRFALAVRDFVFW